MGLTNVDLYRIDGNVGSLSNVQTSALNGGPLAGVRNRIINGDMRIDQRNAGASITPAQFGAYCVDRWLGANNVGGKFSVQQNAGSVTPPVGFSNYLGATSTSAYSIGSSEQFALCQNIEGFNVADLNWGSANAVSVSLSFWVRSSLTGTFGGALQNDGGDRSYPYSFTISSANTWEYKTVTIPGNTTGTWLTNNGRGLRVFFSLGAGSSVKGTSGAWSASNLLAPTGAVDLVATNGATFYITGVQLEAGTVATPFERRSYGAELSLCQRYYGKYEGNGSSNQPSFGTGIATSIMSAAITIQFPQKMRAAPTITISQLAASDATTYDAHVSALSSPQINTTHSRLNVTTATSMIQYRPALLIAQASTSGYIDFSAEL